MANERRQSYRWDFKNKKDIINQWMNEQTNTSLSLQVLVMNFIDRYGFADVTDYDIQKSLNLDTERLKITGQQVDKEMLTYLQTPLPEGIEEKSPEGDEISNAQLSKSNLERKTSAKEMQPGKKKRDYSKIKLDNL